jgi:hypothetical protein
MWVITLPPPQTKLVRMARGFADGGAISPLIGGSSTTITPLGVVAVMVFKPG